VAKHTALAAVAVPAGRGDTGAGRITRAPAFGRAGEVNNKVCVYGCASSAAVSRDGAATQERALRREIPRHAECREPLTNTGRPRAGQGRWLSRAAGRAPEHRPVHAPDRRHCHAHAPTGASRSTRLRPATSTGRVCTISATISSLSGVVTAAGAAAILAPGPPSQAAALEGWWRGYRPRFSMCQDIWAAWQPW